MALAACRECAAQVSTEAATCPRCGVANPAGIKTTHDDPLRAHRRKEAEASVLVVAGLILGIPTCVAGNVLAGWGVTVIFIAAACYAYYK